MKVAIENIRGREILDSRGNPTVEVEMRLTDGSLGRAAVPSGASKGQQEALELRDGDPKRYRGKGVLSAVHHVKTEISRLLVGKAFETVQELDRILLEADGTQQKSRLGANAILGVSMAFAHASAHSQECHLFQILGNWMNISYKNMSLPVPLMNVLNGGSHANNGLEFQEFMIIPHGFETFCEALRAGCEVFQCLKQRLADSNLSTAVGDEGGFAPQLENNEQAVQFLCESIEKAGYQIGKQISLGLDVAASAFFNETRELYEIPHKKYVPSQNLIELYESWISRYPIQSIEDGLHENDWQGWAELTRRLGDRCQLVGDDIFVTQKRLLQKGIEEKVGNSILIKVNQVGSLSETFETMSLAKKSGYRSIVSHRSGETEDITIAHLAVGSGCGQIKTGSLSRSERLAKYNELLRIEEWAQNSNEELSYAGADFRS